ncbi:MAG: AtpZ/AtpI family protein [Nitriliruptoraceae bacterium]
MDDRTEQFRKDAWRDLDTGWIVTVELMSAVAVWMGIGWLLDRWIGTEPWLMVAGAVLGFVLGMYLAYKRSTEASSAEEARFARR